MQNYKIDKKYEDYLSKSVIESRRQEHYTINNRMTTFSLTISKRVSMSLTNVTRVRRKNAIHSWFYVFSLHEISISLYNENFVPSETLETNVVFRNFASSKPAETFTVNPRIRPFVSQFCFLASYSRSVLPARPHHKKSFLYSG